MIITRIKKRNGAIADFNQQKITRAIFKALEATGQPNIDLAKTLSQKVVENISKKNTGGLLKVEEIQDIVEQTLVEKGQAKTAKAYILYRQKRTEIRKQKQQILQKEDIDEIDKKFDINGLRVLCSRYLKKDKQGNIIETPKELFERVAIHTTLPSLFFNPNIFQKKGGTEKQAPALLEKTYNPCLKIGGFILNEFHIEALPRIFNRLNENGQMKIAFSKIIRLLQENKFSMYEKEIKQYFDVMTKRKFLPNTPALINFGNHLGMGSACFVIPVEDSIESIMEALSRSAIVFKSGGGVGYNFSKLRPEGDYIRTTSGKSSGPLSFMSLFDKMTDVIKQGGVRRGASMGILNSDHPDIEKFITAKKGNQALKNFNISVFIKSDFWDYYENKKPYPLKNPKNNEIIKYVDPVSLLDLIIYQAWESAEPGVIFEDHINKHNPLLKALGLIETTNPCLTIDSWIITQNGPRQIKELLGKKTKIVLNDKVWRDNGLGFFKTGKKQVYNLITKEGFSLKATSEHHLRKITSQTRYTIKSKWEQLGNLKKGDKILLNVNKDTEWPGKYSEKEGYLMGFLIGDGCVSSDKTFLGSWGESRGEKNMRKKAEQYIKNFPHRSNFNGWQCIQKNNSFKLASAWLKKLAVDELKIGRKKKITPLIEKCSAQFYKGFLRGFFDTDGSVQGNIQKGISIRLAQSDIARLEAVQRMLLRLGIFSKIYKNRRKKGTALLPNSKGKYKKYPIKTQHELVISCDNILVFKEKIGFFNTDKLEKLNNLLKKYKKKTPEEYFTTEVESVKKLALKNVYNISIPGINSFDANGFWVKNCGELPLYPFESCNLGSINLWAFCDVKPSNGKEKQVIFNWQDLKQTIKTATKFLDNVIEVNKLPLPEIEITTLNSRKIGLGLMGLADTLYELGKPYNSQEGIDFMEKTMEFLNYHSKEMSIELAKRRGAFPLYKKSSYPEGKLPFTGKKEEGALPLEKQTLNWQKLIEDIKKYGIRHSQTTTNAPTGSISMIAGCSSGIEPNFSLVFEKKVTIGSFYYVNPIFEKVMEREGLFDEDLIKTVSQNNGSVQNISYIPTELKSIFKTAMDLNAKDHIKALAILQNFTDSSISKTVNFPSTASLADMKEAYLLAHKLGCKDLTVFRDKSIKGVLSTDFTEKNKRKEKNKNQSQLASLKDEKAKGPVIFHSLSGEKIPPPKTQDDNNNGEICPNCSSFLMASEGCKKCPSCGWAMCSSS